MAAPRKYMFDYDFNQPDPPPDEGEGGDLDIDDELVEEPPPPPPTYSEEELNVAREVAYSDGRQAGLNEASETTEYLVGNSLSQIVDQMRALFQQQEEANDANARNAVRVAMSVVRKMLPASYEKFAVDEVVRVVGEVIAHILDEPRIIVRVAPALGEKLGEALDSAAKSQGFEGRVMIQEDQRLTPGDCRVEWADGGAERDQARLMAEVEATVDRALAPPERHVAGTGEGGAV